MNKPRVYVETSVISYLAARPSLDAQKIARQHSSAQLWSMRKQYDLFVSEIVLDEASLGDPMAAQLRLQYLDGIPRLRDSMQAQNLARQLVAIDAVPSTSFIDSLHIALAAVNEMNYIASWNFKHIAGAVARIKITQALRDLGYARLTIHTPDELLVGIP